MWWLKTERMEQERAILRQEYHRKQQKEYGIQICLKEAKACEKQPKNDANPPVSTYYHLKSHNILLLRIEKGS